MAIPFAVAVKLTEFPTWVLEDAGRLWICLYTLSRKAAMEEEEAPPTSAVFPEELQARASVYPLSPAPEEPAAFTLRTERYPWNPAPPVAVFWGRVERYP